MKFVLGTVIGILGISSLAGCSAEVGSPGEESVSTTSDALLVTAAALSSGTRRDYDGDGKEDVLFFTNDIGTYETLGTSPGGFSLTPTTLIRSDLTPSNTKYTAGDFNHDGKTDLLVTTSSGTFEWTGKAGGGFNTSVWSTTLFKLNAGTADPNFDIVVGDFNGDGFTDFIATTTGGSYLYTGKGTGGASGGFNANVWTNTTTAFKRGNVTFTVGNFDTNATSDFIASTATGGFLYTGTAGSGASGGFTANVWTDSSLANGTYPNVTRIVAANFNGVGGDDFIVQRPSGAFLYTAKTPQPAGGPSFNVNAWSDSSLGITGSTLAVGDYNGDGCSDFLYQDTALRLRTYKQGTPSVPGTFSAALLVDTRFPGFYDFSIKRGDFTGDGKDDFVIQSRPTTGDGSHEFTGTSSVGATPLPAHAGFNADVWNDSGSYQGSAW